MRCEWRSAPDAAEPLPFVGLSRNRLVRREVPITLDRKTESTAHCLDLRKADRAQLGAAYAEFAEMCGQRRKRLRAALGVALTVTAPLSVAGGAWPGRRA